MSTEYKSQMSNSLKTRGGLVKSYYKRNFPSVLSGYFRLIYLDLSIFGICDIFSMSVFQII